MQEKAGKPWRCLNTAECFFLKHMHVMCSFHFICVHPGKEISSIFFPLKGFWKISLTRLEGLRTEDDHGADRKTHF